MPKQAKPPAVPALPAIISETDSLAIAAGEPVAPIAALPLPAPWLPSLGVIEAPDLTYYETSELDTPAEPEQPITPFLPLWALQDETKKVIGRAVLRLWINEQGGVDELEVVESNPLDLMDENALYVWRHAKFIPAMKNGKQVRNQKLIEVTFGDQTKLSPDQVIVIEPAIEPGSDVVGGLPRFRSKRDH